MMSIRIFIVDDHAVLRAGLRMLLGAQPDMTVVGEAADGEEALGKVREINPDVVTLDLTMPGGSGLRVIERLRQECPKVRVLVLTMHDDPAYFRAALAAGSSGYVVKSAPEAEVLSAIRAVSQGRTFVNLSLTNELVQTVLGGQQLAGLADPADPKAFLSPREQEVLRLTAQGHTNRQIADQLFLSVKTIETYRARLMAKLGLENRADLVRYAAAAGLLDPHSFAAANESP
jgi:two-component system response regulator NreC